MKDRHREVARRVCRYLLIGFALLMLPANSIAGNDIFQNFSFDDCDPFEARALIMEPDILIYDEPTTGLDPLAARNVDRLIAETAERFRVTSLVITHDMATCYGVGQRVSLLHQGVIQISGSIDDLAASDDPVVRQFLASSGVKAGEVESLLPV